MATLSSKARKSLPSSDFAIPSKRAYPIEDQAHARDALGRVAQDGTPAEKAEVDAAVHRRYPEIDEGPTHLGDHHDGPTDIASRTHGERMAEHRAAR